MKKVISFIFSVLFAMILSVSLFNVQAAETEQAVLVYVEAPTGWEAPHVWTWDDDGTGAYANLGWPGKAMVEDQDNPGWYYLYIPGNMTNVIINANEGGIQTSAFTISGENVWVTIVEEVVTGDDGDETVYTPTASTTQATTGDLPVYIPTKYVYAYVPVDWDTAGIWAWNNESGEGVYTTWPGEEMTLLDDGWFMIEVPDSADRVIINNLVATDGEQTVDLTVGTENVYIQVGDLNDDDKYEATLTDEKPVIIEDGFTIYITIPEDWTQANLWAWSHPDGTGLYTTWPGEEIAYDQESGYYVVIVPTWVNRVIVNNGSTGDDAAQTIDTEITEAGDFYLYVGDANDEGKFTTTISAEPIVETPDEPESSNAWIYGIVGGAILVAGAFAAFIIFNKKKA